MNIKEIFTAILIGGLSIALIASIIIYESGLRNYKTIAEETLVLLDKATKKGTEYQKHSEEAEKYLKDTVAQFEVMKGIAETSHENTTEAQKQVKALLEEIKVYQEHVDQYIAVITWYEKKCRNCPDPNLPD